MDQEFTILGSIDIGDASPSSPEVAQLNWDTWAETDDRFFPSYKPLPTHDEFLTLAKRCDKEFKKIPPGLLSYRDEYPKGGLPTAGPPPARPLSEYASGRFNISESERDAINTAGIGQNSQSEFVWDPSIGSWPQRLLHVPSMTSVKWQLGNMYGEYEAPNYNAVSYTWGRYAFHNEKSKKYKQAESVDIDVQNCWNIPRIDSQHFEHTEFEALIKQICANDEEIDFLWLDVACIDQNSGPQKAIEIGRQAQIFRGASNVYIWLTKLTTARLVAIWEDIEGSADWANVFAKELPGPLDTSTHRMIWVATARQALDELLSDPWFSSLWTLQEAFLCPQSYLLARNGDTQILRHAKLSKLCSFCEVFVRACEKEIALAGGLWKATRRTRPHQHASFAKWMRFLNEVQDMITKRGLSALASQNCIALYQAAGYRRTQEDWDRVYGIQQVFDLRLGASANPNMCIKTTRNLLLLENQLGTEILRRHPVLSQMHVFTEPVEEGRGWRIGPSSRIPRLDISSQDWHSARFDEHCRLSTVMINSQLWGSFQGLVCPFENLQNVWAETDHSIDQQDISNSRGRRAIQQIFLDTTLTSRSMESFLPLEGSPLGPEWSATWGKSFDMPRTRSQQHQLSSWITKNLSRTLQYQDQISLMLLEKEIAHIVVRPTYRDEELEQLRQNHTLGALIALLLGSFKDKPLDAENVSSAPIPVQTVDDQYNVGLILVERQSGELRYWKRIGFCIWQVPNQARHGPFTLLKPDKALFSGPDSEEITWKTREGLFG